MSKNSPDRRTPAVQTQMEIHSAPVSLKDIAKACGMSVMTVSYALRADRKYVSERTIAAVSEVARKMGYDPTRNLAARKLRVQNTDQKVVNHIAAVFFPYERLDSPYWSRFMQGIQTAFAARYYGVFSCRVDERHESFSSQLPHLFRRGDVDGAVAVNVNMYIEQLRAEAGFGGRPVVTLLEETPTCSSVLADDAEAGRLAAGHLLDMGHRHLLCFRNSLVEKPIPNNRLKGFRQAYHERGLSEKGLLSIAPWVWDDAAGLEPALSRVLRKHPKTTAILSPNDGNAITLARALHRLGKSIPRDYSLVSVDDCEVLSGPDYNNILTTVRLPLAEMGKRAADMLMDQVEQGTSETQSVTLPVSLVVRGSAAPYKQ